MINKKKSITLRNRTVYFNPDTTRVKVHFSSPESYQSRQIKIEGYENRLYWHYKYCDEHKGQTFFYTLTYNDKAMPKKYGFNCFDYEDLRDLLTGGFRKKLLRQYGTKFKYFIGAELGDGKGSRGMHNNPHYHILFFLESAEDPQYPYKVISPKDFRHLVRMYWQGFDEDTDGFRDYNEAKYGIAKEGENEGLVTDFRACSYVAKYVCKDVKLKKNEPKVESKIRFREMKKFKYSEDSYKLYFQSRIYEMYNIPRNAKHTEWTYDDVQLIQYLLPTTQNDWLFCELDYDEIKSYRTYVPKIIAKYGLWEDYVKFCKNYIQPRVDDGMNEYRNRYCNKCRISQGVGDYALETMDKLNPTVKVPSKKGFKDRPIGMYYYRKLFMDVMKDCKGQNIYVLNEDGIRYKVNRLPSQLKKMSDKALANYMLVLGNRGLFEKMRESDVNVDVTFHYDGFLRKMNELLKLDDLQTILKKYAEYKLVYEDRFFAFTPAADGGVLDFPPIDVIGDYKRFLVPSFFSVPRNDIRLECFLENPPANYMAYYEHPYFLRYISIFSVLDLCTDYFFIQGDNKRQADAEQIAATKRFHDQQRLKDFYSQFK